MISVTAVGRLGQDVEIKAVGEGTVANFSLAVSRKVKGESVSDWYNCSLWGKSGEAMAQYLKKGDVVGVSGTLEQRKYTAKDGTEKVSVEIKCTGFSFIPGANAKKDNEDF
jgi:single-strand DNA-binding protein